MPAAGSLEKRMQGYLLGAIYASYTNIILSTANVATQLKNELELSI